MSRTVDPVPFKNDDEKYARWLCANPHGIVLNVRDDQRAPTVLHSGSCGMISGLPSPGPGKTWTHGLYRKLCSLSRERLVQWAHHAGHEQVKFCLCLGRTLKPTTGRRRSAVLNGSVVYDHHCCLRLSVWAFTGTNRSGGTI
jgi:hypothetical protein